MANILVTGGAGYIGSHTCVELLEAGHDVIVISVGMKKIKNIEKIVTKIGIKIAIKIGKKIGAIKTIKKDLRQLCKEQQILLTQLNSLFK